MGPMQPEEIERILGACERSLDAGRTDLREQGFWRVVGALKRAPELRARFASRVAEADRRAFLSRVRIAVPLPVGVALLLLGTAAGIALLAAAFALDGAAAGVAVLLGAGALEGTTHDLAHLAVGRVVGIRFTHWYTDPPARPQPGVKIDYASYLRASANGRAWMHASGAIATKIVPFVCLPLALASSAPWWTAAVLAALGVVQIATDVLFSVRSGDWKKFQRERRFARPA